MTVDGTWDLYGNLHAAFDGMTMIEEADVKKICDERKKNLDEKKAKELKALEEKMKKELMQRFHERQLLEHEVDTTSIDGMFDIYNQLGGIGADSQQKELEEDFAALEEIIGELNYDEMAVLKQTNPVMFIILIERVFNFLMYLAHIPFKDKNGKENRMNLYQTIMDHLLEHHTVDGKIPEWLERVHMIYDWGMRFGAIVEKANNGEFADILVDIIP